MTSTQTTSTPQARRVREINALRMIIDGTLWTLTSNQLHMLMTDRAMPQNIRDAAQGEWDAKADRGIF